MARRYASAGPNKQMYDIYNMSIRQSGDPGHSYRTNAFVNGLY